MSWSFSVQWFEMRGGCSFQWYWSLFKHPFPNVDIMVGRRSSNNAPTFLMSGLPGCSWFPLVFLLRSFYISGYNFLYPYLQLHQTRNVLRCKRGNQSRKRWKTENKMNNWKGTESYQRSTKHYTNNIRYGNMNPTRNMGWTQVIRKGSPLLYYYWQPSWYC
jgi:hypothetical protein